MYELRPYQKRGVNDIRRSYLNGNRAPLYVLPTGGGKTVMFSYITMNSAARGKNVLILNHRVELVRQTKKHVAETGIRPGIINSKFTPDYTCQVQVGSVQTMTRRLDKVPFTPDLIIVDEAHHATARTWRKILEYYDKAHVLGVTATPIRTDGAGLGVQAGGLFDDLIVGPQIGELIENDYLVEPVVYAPQNQIDLSGLHTRGGDYKRKEAAELMDKPTITGDAVKHYSKLCAGAPAVAFCVSVSHAEHVAEQFRQAGYKAASVDGSTDDARREALIDGLGTGEVEVLTSCDLIGEGVDVPAIKCAILLRPTQSMGLYLQQVGRALRPAPGKHKAIILDHVGNCITHGLPDEERQWSLDGEKKQSRNNDGEKTVRVKQCEECFAVHPPAPECPFCGYEYETTDKTPEHVEGELQEITPEQKARMKRRRRREQANAESLEELKKLAEKRGYSPGWAYHVWKGRQEKKAG